MSSTPTTLADLLHNEDVLYNILSNAGTKAHDLTWLWTNCREVSHGFKDAAELVFLRRHLRHTYFSTDLGVYYGDREANLYVNFKFSKLDASDPSQAIFRTEYHTGPRQEVAKRLETRFRNGNSVVEPRLLIRIRSYVNDTRVPGFQGDWERLEIRCDWKGMFTEWFTEEKEHARRLKVVVNSVKEQAAMGDGSQELLFAAMMAFSDSYESIWKKIRAERIRRNARREWEERGGESGWKEPGPDNRGYKQLKEARFDFGFASESSSEESGGEEEGEDGGESVDNQEGY
ncbi:hypothetical protein BXZ70DRAFT_52100 [Cristinia sonorae]|uniref:Uncharacterized protein n=1 Tax=Cristinia sonorae TaxID=1940300 RepID=A0A8K0UT76_9AGAR|nr:hypothetical protein BXZ70DRAFT_52100 [Cristinia sonorae]